MIRVAIAGSGRMGQAIAAGLEQQGEMSLVGIWNRGDDLDKLVSAADVVIDFSLPEGTQAVLASVERLGKPLVCGVSGLDAETMERLRQVAGQVPLLYDRNMSLGIAVLEHSVREAARALGPEFEIEIAEVHHVHKKDSPSGTALKLADAIVEARGQQDSSAISFQSERRGEVPGDHEVVMRSATEKLTFAHSVTTRQVFADGAIEATRWIVGQPAGLYGMHDVLLGK